MKRIVGFFILIWIAGAIPSLAAESTGGMTPDAALALLKAGHDRFLTGQFHHPHQDSDRRAETAKGQHPYAAILGCSDSRGALDVIFDAGIGDLFTIRVAGNVADVDEIASLEYGAEHLGVPLILVLGHTSCGAVTAVVQKASLTGQLPGLLDNVQAPAARAAKSFGSTAPDLVDQTARENVLQSIQDMLAHSKVLSELVEAGKLRIVGGLYHLDSGEVDWTESPSGLNQWVQAGLAYQPRPADFHPLPNGGNSLPLALGLLVGSIFFLSLVQRLFLSDRRLVRSLKFLGRLVVSSLSLVTVLAVGAVLTVASGDLVPLGAALVPVLLFAVLFARVHYLGFQSFYMDMSAKWTARSGG